MKKLSYYGLCILLICISTISCQKNDIDDNLNKQAGVEARHSSSVDKDKLNPEAVTYFSNIATAIFATGSNSPVTRSTGEENPLIDKLENIEIVKDETSSGLSFFEMTTEEQKLFLNDWALLQAEQMSQKISANPELLDHVMLENEVIGSVLNEEIIETRSGEAKVKDNKAFFAKISERFKAKNKELEDKLKNENNPETRAGISFGSNLIPFSRFKSNFVASARRGDFIVALPTHGHPYIYLDFGNDRFKVGHASVISNASSSISENTQITLGAQIGDGVIKERAEHWSVQSYVMGIQKIRWVWKWRGFKSRFYREVHQMHPGALADWAQQYEGRGYVRWYEFATAKWAAPSRFTCTTLVWWCAKKAYDVNISSWWATMVTPGGLVTDESTYVRRVIN